MSNTTTRRGAAGPLPRRLYPQVKIMTCPQIAASIRRRAANFPERQRRQLELIAVRIARATKRADQITALEDACAASCLGTTNPHLSMICKLAAKAARQLDQRTEAA